MPLTTGVRSLCLFAAWSVFSTRCEHCPDGDPVCHFGDENARTEVEASHKMFLNFLPLSDEIQSCVLYSDLVLFNITVDKMGDC